MARFFIDTDNGTQRVCDDQGVDLPDAEHARPLALKSLVEMARDTVHSTGEQTFTVSMRTGTGTIVYTASLVLTGRWVTADTMV